MASEYKGRSTTIKNMDWDKFEEGLDMLLAGKFRQQDFAAHLGIPRQTLRRLGDQMLEEWARRLVENGEFDVKTGQFIKGNHDIDISKMK